MLAEVQKLAVELNLTGNIQSAVPQAERAFAGLNQTASRAGGVTGALSRGFGAVGKAASGIGSALGHAKSQLVGLLTGPLGLLGLGAGLFSLGGLFTAGVAKARDFGGEVKRLAALTGLSVETTSKLAAAFDHFGISADQVSRIAGMAEKNLGLLTETQKKANEFATKYGLALTDASGHVKDFNTLLLDTADFWNNKSIPAQTKAVALQKLYGRSWQDLIPVLAAGRAGITAAEQEAARLGLTLTKDNIDALTKSKEATRQWSDALGGLKLQIGLAVLPTLTNLTRGLTSFVTDNREKIVGFIRGVTEGGAKLADAFATSVLPAVKSVIAIFQTAAGAAGGVSFVGILSESASFAKDLGNALNSFVVPAIKGIVGAWNGLPDELRQLLIKGFIANRVVKWTFGFDAVGFGLSMAKSFIGAVLAEKVATTVAGGLGSAASLLKPVPVFVTNEGFGNLPNVLAPAAGAGAAGLFGAGGILGTGLTVAGLGVIAAPIAAAVIVTLLAHQPGTVPNPAQSPLLNPPGGQTGTGIGGMPYGSASKPATVVLGGRDTDKLGDISADQKAAQMGMGALGNAMHEQNLGINVAANNMSDATRSIQFAGSTTVGAIRGLRMPLDALHRDFREQLGALRKATSTADILRSVKGLVSDVMKGVGSAEGTRGIIAELRKKREVALAAKDYTALRVIDAAIRKVEAKLPNREWVARQLAEAKRTADSSASTKSKIDTLTAIQRTLRDRGDIHAANLIRNKINELKGTTARAGHDTAAAANRAAAAIRAKKLAFINNTTVNVSTYVSPATIRHVTTTYNRYGTQVE